MTREPKYYVWNDMTARFHCEVVRCGDGFASGRRPTDGIAVTNIPHPFTAVEAERYAHEIHEQCWGMQHNVSKTWKRSDRRVVDAETMVEVLVLKARFS